jgi:Bacterial Ig-like domain (group 3)/FG-GAP-like repeat
MCKMTRHSSVLISALVAILTNCTGFVLRAQTTSGGRHSATTVSIFAQNNSGARLAQGAAVASATIASRTSFDANPLGGNLPLFVPVVTYDANGGERMVVVGDVNGDGKQDVIAGAGCSIPDPGGCLKVLLGNGDGTLQPAVSYISDGDSPTVAVADVNGDGKLDIVVANSCSDINCFTEGFLGVLFGNGDGTFQQVVKLWQGFAGAVAVADFNGDGKLDITVANWWLGTIGVLLGNGNGTFSSPVFYDTGGARPSAIAIADLNHDQELDLAVANADSGNVGVLLGNGDGTFQAAIPYSSVGKYNLAVVVADVNKDGALDLVTANWLYEEIATLLGKGDGTFRPAVTYGLYGYATSMTVADVDGDGKLDVVVAGKNDVYSDGAIDILLGNGDGTFRAYNSQPVPKIGSVALGNLDRTGKPDLVLAMGAVGVMLHVGSTATTTTAASANNPSTFGQAVTLTALANSASGVPPGSVEFFEGSSALASTPLVNGTGSISISSLKAGSHAITAMYQGSPKFKPSFSPPLSQVVNIANTGTSIKSFPDPAAPGQSVTYSVTVATQYGAAASGTVTFQDGGTNIATVPLKAQNQAMYRTSYPALGVHSITAKYSGDANNHGSTSSALMQYIEYTTSTALITSGSPTFVGQSVTLTATVTSSFGAIPDGEPATFYDGTTALASVALKSGVAAYTTSFLSARTHLLKAVYSGDGVFAPSSGKTSQVVNLYPSSTSVPTPSLNPSIYGQLVTLTATVTSTAPSVPTGSVVFKNGMTSFASGTVTSTALATVTTRTLPVGLSSITATYRGDSETAKSTSAALTQTVIQATSATTVRSSLNPSLRSQTVSFTAIVTSPTTTPTGTVTFMDGSTILGTGILSGGRTTYSTTTLISGPHNITTMYGGTSNIKGSSSATLVQNVN